MEEKSRFLKRDSGSATKSYSAPSTGSLDSMVSACVSELMNAGTAIHKLHLKITSTGSYAAHKALNELYDALPGHADDLAEGFQGASEKLLTYTEVAPKTLNTVAEASLTKTSAIGSTTVIVVALASAHVSVNVFFVVASVKPVTTIVATPPVTLLLLVKLKVNLPSAPAV